MDGTLTGTITQGQSGLGSNSNEEKIDTREFKRECVNCSIFMPISKYMVNISF